MSTLPRYSQALNVHGVELCDRCRDMLPMKQHYRFASEIEQLCLQKEIKENAEWCRGCLLLLRGLTSYGIDDSSDFMMSNRFSRITVSDFDRTILFTAFEGTQNPWNLRPFELPSFPTTRSHATMELALKWVRDCAKHERCNKRSDPPLPARILDIGTTTSHKVVLREPVNQKGRYLCLSYCWGKSEFIRTKENNIDAHKEGIPQEMLPPTFRDAIEVAHRLRVRYIWIDSLCIIQDNSADWKRESGKMADIYRNSFLTIAATWADSPYAGCFTTSSRIEIDSVCAQLIYHFPNSPALDESNCFPLLSRAWAYQERLLAPRVLHFGLQEIVWECFDTRWCECGAGESYFLDEVDKRHFFDTLIQPVSDDYQTPDKLWRQIVIQYSPLALTVASDKLPALSGLAEQIRRSSNQIYLAGLWKNSLPLDLLWYRTSTCGTLPQPSLGLESPTWRAPSWSWASVDGPIIYDQWLYSPGSPKIMPEVFCEILPDEWPTVDQPATGQIGLRCSMIQVSYRDGRLYLRELSISFRSDNRINLQGAVLYVVRMAQIPGGEELLVVRAIDPSRKLFMRVGLASYSLDGLPWSEKVNITVI